MKFVVIVVGILLLQRMGSLSWLQRDGWYSRWVAWLTSRPRLQSSPRVKLLVALLVPVFLLVVVLLLLDDRWLGVPLFLVSFAVFLYSLGRGHLATKIDVYREDLKRDDLQAAFHDAAEFNPAKAMGVAENWRELHREVIAAMSYRHFERYFAVMFWFVLAGAPAALLYRLMVLHQDMALGEDEEKGRLRAYLTLMEWLPSRLMGLALAFVGNFSSCLAFLRSTLRGGSMTTSQVMAGCVLASLPLGRTSDSSAERVSEVNDINALFSRVMIFSLCVVAFLVLLI